jgi:hypothetical protein
LASRPPQWAVDSGRPIRRLSMIDYQVGLSITPYIETIRYRIAYWNGTLVWNPLRPDRLDQSYCARHPFRMWLTLRPEGVYSFDDLSGDNEYTTHTSDRACMSIQGMPGRINSNRALTLLEEGISRGVRECNINSPLSTDLRKYNPIYLSQLPMVVRNLLDGHYVIRPDLAIPDPGQDRVTPEAWLATHPQHRWDNFIPDSVDAAQTFTVQPITVTPPVTPPFPVQPPNLGVPTPVAVNPQPVIEVTYIDDIEAIRP